ncbi:MAG: NAD-dependent epimerase/dehydratase family protein [Flavobacteriia bacterium]|jgi:nucleoside-diphosphate-sugar epimerase
MNYQHKKILITGGTGFIGSRLAERLVLEEKADVSILVNSWSKATWVSRLDVKLLQGTILDQEKLDEITQGFDLIFHCVGVGGSLDHCMKINVEGTKNVLKAALNNKVKRVVYLSSVVVTGAAISDGMNEEISFKVTGNSYADSKIEAEKCVLDFAQNHDLEVSIIRPTFVWGPISPYYTIDIIQQMKAKTFQMVNEGSGACNAVYIDNLIDLALLCGIHEKAKNEVFLVRDAEKITWRNFYNYYASMLKMDLNDFVSIPSESSYSRRTSLKFKNILERGRKKLTYKVIQYSETHPLKTKLLFKAPRKIIKILIKPIARKYPEMDAWEVETFASKGYLDISKANDLLGYSPQISIAEGMKMCEKSLKLQNFF